MVGSSGQSHNRNINAASTTYSSATNSVTWTTPVTDIEVVVPNTASVTKVLVVYDAPSDAVASAWLSDIGSAGADVAYDWVLPNSRFSRQFAGVAFGRTLPGIQRIDVLPFGANTAVGIGAV